jgi:hypothetical protein
MQAVPVEAFEDPLVVLRRSTDAGVRDADLGVPVVHAGADADLAGRRGVLDGVVEQDRATSTYPPSGSAAAARTSGRPDSRTSATCPVRAVSGSGRLRATRLAERAVSGR